MAADPLRPSLASVLLLQSTRRVAGRPRYRAIAVASVLTYVFVAMLVGQMLVIVTSPTERVSSFWEIIPQGQPWWNYPALLVVTSQYTLVLPFFNTFTMILVSFGVALGMTAAVYLGAQLLRQRRLAGQSGTAGAGALAGLSPALISLVTLGACCSTTAAALAGLTWTAAITGTTLAAVLLNSWFPGVFQLGVLYIALLAQEQLLRAYASFTPPSELDAERESSGGGATRRTPGDPRAWSLRVALLIGGTTWLLALPAEWTLHASPPLTAPFLFQAVVEHLLPAGVTLAAGFFPGRLLEALLARGRPSAWGIVGRATVGFAGASLLAWYPAAWASQGAFGWVNELLGAAGFGPSWGAVAPPFAGLALAFRWGMQFALLGAFCLLTSLFPERVGALLGQPGSVAELGAMARPVAPTGRPSDAGDPDRRAAELPEAP